MCSGELKQNSVLLSTKKIGGITINTVRKYTTFENGKCENKCRFQTMFLGVAHFVGSVPVFESVDVGYECRKP